MMVEERSWDDQTPIDWRKRLGRGHKPSRLVFRNCYWVLAEGKDFVVTGRKYVLGPFGSETDADADCLKNNLQHYEIYCLSTSDKGAAREMLRKKNLDQSHDIEQAFHRFKWDYTKDDSQ